MNPTERLIRKTQQASDETRRGTVLTPMVLTPWDTGGQRSRVWTISVDAGMSRPLRGVIVMSQTGTGGRRYADPGKPVLLRRNLGGQWFAVGPSDRTSQTGNVQLLDESTEAGLGANAGPGFTYQIRPWNYYLTRWGSPGFGNYIVLDADGNEVIT